MLELVEAQPFFQVIKNSRFLAELFTVRTPEEARATLANTRTSHADGGHVVHAFAVGPQANILGCSDDGEPAGTAGRPVLEVLTGSKITNVILTVTRWWGGTKLGTGGLVRAYSTSAQGVIATAVTREIIAMKRLAFTLPYSQLESGKRALADGGFAISSEDYNADGDAITGSLPAADYEPLARRLADLTRGAIVITDLDAPPET